MTEIRLRNDLDELSRLEGAIAAFAAERNLDRDRIKALQLVVEELVTNVVRHGYDDGGEHEIVVRLGFGEPGDVSIEVEDDGRPFDLTRAAVPIAGSSKGEREVGGRGIALVRRLTEGLRYERRAGRNLSTMRVR